MTAAPTRSSQRNDAVGELAEKLPARCRRQSRGREAKCLHSRAAHPGIADVDAERGPSRCRACATAWPWRGLDLFVRRCLGQVERVRRGAGGRAFSDQASDESSSCKSGSGDGEQASPTSGWPGAESRRREGIGNAETRAVWSHGGHRLRQLGCNGGIWRRAMTQPADVTGLLVGWSNGDS